MTGAGDVVRSIGTTSRIAKETDGENQLQDQKVRRRSFASKSHHFSWFKWQRQPFQIIGKVYRLDLHHEQQLNSGRLCDQLPDLCSHSHHWFSYDLSQYWLLQRTGLSLWLLLWQCAHLVTVAQIFIMSSWSLSGWCMSDSANRSLCSESKAWSWGLPYQFSIRWCLTGHTLPSSSVVQDSFSLRSDIIGLV
jgi:hypothetical protein